MRLFRVELLLELLAYSILCNAQTVYITQLPVFKALAPCASNAVSAVVQDLTNARCPALVTQLAICACTQDQNSASISSKISSYVIYSCGSTATDDVTSAAAVFGAYCNQATPVAVPSASAGAVSKYITDISAMADLAPCAYSGLSYVVQYLTNYKCPSGASALQSCACTKNQNSLAVSDGISSQLAYTCGSTHSADISSAQAIFAGYCGLAAGKSVFPTPSYLPGNVNYYITGLPMYSALALCARWGVSYPVMYETNYQCPSNPRALVSCICVKDGNLDAVSSAIISDVKYSCGSTADTDITAALSVLDYYCSAGKGLVTPGGGVVTVTTSAAAKTTGTTMTTTTTSASPGSPPQTQAPLPTEASALPGSNNDPSTTSGGTPGATSSPAAVPVAAIAGGVAGGALFILAMILIGCLYRRKKRYTPPPVPAPVPVSASGSPPAPDYSKVELPSNAAAPKPPPVKRKPLWSIVSSPVSPVEEPAPVAAELGGRTPNKPHGYEVAGSTAHPIEMGSANRTGPRRYEMYAP